MTDAIPRRKVQPSASAEVPKTDFLRGSPATIIGRVFDDLQQRFPPPSPLVYHVITSHEGAPLSERADLRKLFRRWDGISDAVKRVMEEGTALHHRATRELAVLRYTVEKFESPVAAERAKGVYILAHEYWHVLRVTPSSLDPDIFEEGSADLFGAMQAYRLTGYVVKPPVLVYAEYVAEVEGIIRAVAPPRVLDWLLESRRQPDLEAWVAGELRRAKTL